MNDSEKPKSSWRERRQTIKHKWLAPFIFPEWLCERVSYFLGQWAFLDILGHAGRLTILVAVIFYFAESGSRRKAGHYQAWQVINAAQGKTGNCGRMDALQDLNKDKLSLAGIDISNAHLPGIDLENADLKNANLSGANLRNANLAGAELGYVNFSGAALYNADLSGAALYNADLSGVNLGNTNLSKANLANANLSKAGLGRANLSGANIFQADLSGVFLSFADLSGADLTEANLSGAKLGCVDLSGVCLNRADLRGAHFNISQFEEVKNWQKIRGIRLANIYGIVSFPKGFVEWAKEQGVVSLDSDDEWKKTIQVSQLLEWERQQQKKEQEKTKEK